MSTRHTEPPQVIGASLEGNDRNATDAVALFSPGQRQDQKEERLQPRFYSGL